MNQWDELIEETLRKTPLEEPPAFLAESILRRVRQTPQAQPAPAAVPARPAPRPAFRLTWLDYALSLFFAAMLGTLALITDTLPPELRRYWGQELSYWAQSSLLDLRLLPAGYVLLLAGLAAAVLLSALAIWLVRPASRLE